MSGKVQLYTVPYVTTLRSSDGVFVQVLCRYVHMESTTVDDYRLDSYPRWQDTEVDVYLWAVKWLKVLFCGI